jgi:hypothetical protein
MGSSLIGWMQNSTGVKDWIGFAERKAAIGRPMQPVTECRASRAEAKPAAA